MYDINMEKVIVYHIYADGDPDTLAFNLAHLGMYASRLDHVYIKVVYNDPNKLKDLDVYLLSGAFDLSKTTILKMPNNPELGENVGFTQCMEMIKHAYPNSLVLIASTNGVSKPTETFRKNVRAWSRAMYHFALRDLYKVEQVFKQGYNCYGIQKKEDPMDKGGNATCPWHYSGLFYWVRASEFFKRDWKGKLTPNRYGLEMLPGYLFDTKEAFCPFNTPNDLYHYELQTSDYLKELMQ